MIRREDAGTPTGGRFTGARHNEAHDVALPTVRPPASVTAAALQAHRDTTEALLGMAPTVHGVVQSRVTALREAYGRFEHPLETAEEFACRVLADGQQPFPPGQSIYDDPNSNRGYEHVTIGYGAAAHEGPRITFSGTYPHWDDDGTYELRHASVHCPSWLLTDLGGADRYRAQTAEMVADIKAERALEHEKIETLMRAAFAARAETLSAHLPPSAPR